MKDDTATKNRTPETSRNERPLLSIRDAGRVYRMGEVDVHALRGATLDIHDGDFLIVIGASGSGKSTLLNLIGGMDRPTSGEVLFEGVDLGRASDRELTLYRRGEVGFVFQFYNLIPTLTALENIQVATEIADSPLDPMEALSLVDMTDRADHFPSQLSGGQQQRVAMARALAGNPRMLLCDEPTGALDSESACQVLSLLARLSNELGKTVVLITHNPAIPQIGRRTARLHDGRIVSIEENPHQIPPEEIDW